MRLIFGEVDLWEFDLGEVDGFSFEIISIFSKLRKQTKVKNLIKSDQI